MKTLQIFISSPGDVYEERTIANRVIERLQSEYMGRVVLKPVLWEHEPLVATSNFQEQIVSPSETDVVISILWSRLGTPLPADFKRDDGSRYDSGTEFEFEEALKGARESGKPDLLVYRKSAPPSVRLDDEKELLERLGQKKKLDEFVNKWFHDKAEGTLVAAFHAFESPSEFETLLENHLHKLVERHLPKSTSGATPAPAAWKQGSPFRGLASFDFEHAPVFFGRTKAASDILQALREQAADGRPFVLVLGMSGGGKSSVVRAGVMPMLVRPGVIEGVAGWRRAIFHPTDVRGDLFAGLATALLSEHALPGLDPDQNGCAELASILRESPQAAASMIKTALRQEATVSKIDGELRLALAVDQMEEIYTQEGVGDSERRHLIDVLDALVRSGSVWVVATLRSDFYPRIGRLPKLGALKEGAGQYDLMPPTADEIGQMIRLPTRAAGLSFGEDPTTGERLDDLLRDAAAGRREVLPLLQFTLEELYQRRSDDGVLTLEAYRALGGVEGSLAQRAETEFLALSEEAKAALPRVLNELVSVKQDGHDNVGRKRALWTDATAPGSVELLEAFVEARLFVTELNSEGDVIVSVAHEALLWHWPRVSEWVSQNRENLRIRSRITAGVERWVGEGRPVDLLLPHGKPLVEALSLIEHHIDLHEIELEFINASARRDRRKQQAKAGIAFVMAGLAVVAGGAALVANEQRSRAEVEAETARRTTEFMVDLFQVSDPSESLGNTITAREILDKGAARIEQELSDQPEAQATLMDTMGTVYTSLGLYGAAEPLVRNALLRREELFGDEHMDVASSKNHLGELLILSAKYEEAEPELLAALEARREEFGKRHPMVADTLLNLADLRTRTGQYEQAGELIEEALDIRRSHFDGAHEAIAEALEDRGINFFDQGEYEQATGQLREALAMRRELHGDVHPALAQAIGNLQWVLQNSGNLDEAESLNREALDMMRVLHGESHPQIAMGLNNLAYVLELGGDLESAIDTYREALAMMRILVGEEHPDVATILGNLAFVLYQSGERRQGVSLARESLTINRKVLGPTHAAVASGASNLGFWLIGEGEFDEAGELLDEAVSIRRAALGDSHPLLASSMSARANLYLAAGRDEEARDEARRAREILLDSVPTTHWRVAAAATVEGAALTRLGQFETAEPLLLDSVEPLQHAPIPGLTEQNRQRLYDLYTAWQKPDLANKFRRAE